MKQELQEITSAPSAGVDEGVASQPSDDGIIKGLFVGSRPPGEPVRRALLNDWTGPKLSKTIQIDIFSYFLWFRWRVCLQETLPCFPLSPQSLYLVFTHFSKVMNGYSSKCYHSWHVFIHIALNLDFEREGPTCSVLLLYSLCTFLGLSVYWTRNSPLMISLFAHFFSFLRVFGQFSDDGVFLRSGRLRLGSSLGSHHCKTRARLSLYSDVSTHVPTEWKSRTRTTIAGNGK